MSKDFPIDPSAPLFVGGTTIAAGITGAFTGASIGYAKNLHPLQLGVNMSINCSVAALAFFGTREYLVSPILLGLGATPSHERRAAILRGEPIGPENVSVTDMRLERVLDSAISGALSGGGISLLARGPRTLLPAAFTASLIASIAQVGVNQGRVMRLEFLAKRARSEDANPLPPVAVVVPEVDARASFENPAKPANATRGDAPISARILNVLTTILPVRKLGDQEYLDALERRRKQVDKRLVEIDEEQLAMFENQARQ